jgi:hypothetical protein
MDNISPPHHQSDIIVVILDIEDSLKGDVKMSRILPHKALLRNLAQLDRRGCRTYLTKELAYEELKLSTGQDFGDDYRAWEQWFKGKTWEEAMPNVPLPFDPKRRHAVLMCRLHNDSLIDLLKDSNAFSDRRSLKGITQEHALEELKTRTGQDFSYDADAWEAWFEQNQDKNDGQSE